MELGSSPSFLPAPLVFGYETNSIVDATAPLSVAYVTAKSERLSQGQPVLRRASPVDDGNPQNEDVDPRIAQLGS
jgi:hypothetical protein